LAQVIPAQTLACVSSSLEMLVLLLTALAVRGAPADVTGVLERKFLPSLRLGLWPRGFSNAVATSRFPATRQRPMLLREGWRDQTNTVFGTARSAARDAGDSDEYNELDLEVVLRAAAALERRRDALGVRAAGDPAASLAEALRLQTARRGDEAHRLFVAALLADRSVGAAWYGLASLLHEHQHGGLKASNSSRVALMDAVDAALIAARYEPELPRSLVLLGDVLNDLGDYREACRAWRAAEERGGSLWRTLTAPWVRSGAFSPREPLRSLPVGGTIELVRRTNGVRFTATRLSLRPAAFRLVGFSTAQERDAIVTAARAAPMRDVPASEEDSSDDRREGCAVAWLSSPLTAPESPWAPLMRDSADVVLPSATGVPGAGPLEDLHVVKYGSGGAYGLHLDASMAVPRAVTVLHYLNDVSGSSAGESGETWLPYADATKELEKAVPGENGVLVRPRAGDALVFFGFDEHGDVEKAALHGGRPAPEAKWVANQWLRLDLDSAATTRRSVPRGPGFGPRVIT